jgi:hypothetical protein
MKVAIGVTLSDWPLLYELNYRLDVVVWVVRPDGKLLYELDYTTERYYTKFYTGWTLLYELNYTTEPCLWIKPTDALNSNFIGCFDETFATRSRILILVPNGHIRIKCTKADVQLKTPDDGQKGCPKHVE